MKEWLPQFLSGFHQQHLKPLDFRKNGRTFSRDMGTYWERFNFQGSSHNYPEVETWRFYINVGVEFKDLAPRQYWDHSAHTHLAARLEVIVEDAPRQWEYNHATDREQLARRLVELMMQASQQIGGIIHKARESYDANDFTRRWWL